VCLTSRLQYILVLILVNERWCPTDGKVTRLAITQTIAVFNSLSTCAWAKEWRRAFHLHFCKGYGIFSSSATGFLMKGVLQLMCQLSDTCVLRVIIFSLLKSYIALHHAGVIVMILLFQWYTWYGHTFLMHGSMQLVSHTGLRSTWNLFIYLFCAVWL